MQERKSLSWRREKQQVEAGQAVRPQSLYNPFEGERKGNLNKMHSIVMKSKDASICPSRGFGANAAHGKSLTSYRHGTDACPVVLSCRPSTAQRKPEEMANELAEIVSHVSPSDLHSNREPNLRLRSQDLGLSQTFV